jgi:membrane fusion protein (multidrug efflux system)
MFKNINYKQLLVTISTIFIFGAIGYYFYSGTKESNKTFLPKPFVEVSAATKKVIFDKVEALGNARANESVEITANVTEIVDKIKFADNITVKKGDYIVILQADEEIAQKNAEELRAKEHKRELKRLQILVNRKAETKQKLDQRKTLLAISKQKIIEINAKISDRTIRAPFDGILGLRNISKGTLVKPGDLITTIDDLSKIKIDFWIPSIHLANIHVGMPILAKTEAYQSRDFQGIVSFIDSRVDKNTRSIKVRAIIDNNDLLLRPGLLFNITLLQNKRTSLLVPEESLIAKYDSHYLYILTQDSKVIKQQVLIGKRENGMVEIKTNLNETQKVVTKGVLKIRDGSEVQILINNKTEDAK